MLTIWNIHMGLSFDIFLWQWRIQTGAMGCRKPNMKTVNLNLIQYINFVLGKNNEQGDDDSIFPRGYDFVQIHENSYETSCFEASYQGDRLFAFSNQLR